MMPSVMAHKSLGTAGINWSGHANPDVKAQKAMPCHVGEIVLIIVWIPHKTVSPARIAGRGETR